MFPSPLCFCATAGRRASSRFLGGAILSTAPFSQPRHTLNHAHAYARSHAFTHAHSRSLTHSLAPHRPTEPVAGRLSPPLPLPVRSLRSLTTRNTTHTRHRAGNALSRPQLAALNGKLERCEQIVDMAANRPAIDPAELAELNATDADRRYVWVTVVAVVSVWMILSIEVADSVGYSGLGHRCGRASPLAELNATDTDWRYGDCGRAGSEFTSVRGT